MDIILIISGSMILVSVLIILIAIVLAVIWS